MNKLIESTNINQVLNESGITTETFNTNQEASNDGLVINGETVAVDGITPSFIIRGDGTYYVNATEDAELSDEVYIASAIYVTNFIKCSHTNVWERQVVLKDFAGQWHTVSLPMSDVSGNLNRLVQALSSHGLHYVDEHKKRLYEYIIGCKPSKILTRVDKSGWHGGEYVLPECSIEVPSDHFVYKAPSQSKNKFPKSGTLEEWQENVSSLCVGNSRLLFVVSMAFGSILMPLMGWTSCGVHLSASSSRGKTTALKVAKTVFGSPRDIASWRTTDNGIEATAYEHNNALLCLDELAQLSESGLTKLFDIMYMLANGVGKTRYKGNEELKTWQLYYLSSGELSLRDTFARGGKNLFAGQEVRTMDISADAGSELGIFNTIHGRIDGAAFADEINRNVERSYGKAGRAFIENLTEDKELCLSAAQNIKREFLSSLNLAEADPQVHRVAEHFANIVAAGELASKLNITGWKDGQVAWAGVECFKSWLEMRGGEGSQEEQVAITTVQDKLIQYGHNKFITDDNPKPRGQYWGKREDNDYFVFTNVFNNQICAGLNAKQVVNILVAKGFITQANDRRSTVTKRINGKPTRCFHLNESLFSEEVEENNLTNVTEA